MANVPLKQWILAAFLQLPETEPASEWMNGEIFQKPMPQGKHSRLQSKLCERVNQNAEPQEFALALPELRCTFGGRSLVPDVAVFRWNRIPFTGDGEVPNAFEIVPDWAIEILSPDQSQTRLIDKLVFCLEQGAELGWLIDPEERAVIGYEPNRLPRVYRNSDQLPVWEELFQVTVEELFGWLRVGRGV